MIRGILRYDSRLDAGPMQTSSSANRTCSDSRSASEYTATVWMPSSRQARMTRSAISPRLATRTFLTIPVAALRGGVLLESAPARVARAGHALHAQRELARVRRVEDRALVRDDALRVPVHQRLVEALHPVLDRALLDQVRDVERLRHVADLVADRRRVDEHLGGGDAARLVGARHEAERDDRLERAREREAHLGLLMRWIEREHAVDRLRRVGRVQRREDEVARVGSLERGVERVDVADLADEDDVRVL